MVAVLKRYLGRWTCNQSFFETDIDLLLDRCKSFIDASRKLNKSAGEDLYPYAPRLYLVGHTIELALKSFIRLKAGSFNPTHDLKSLLRKANQLGLNKLPWLCGLSAPWDELKLLTKIMMRYYPNKLRYPEIEIQKRYRGTLAAYNSLSPEDEKTFLPDIKEASNIAECLYDAVKKIHRREGIK